MSKILCFCVCDRAGTDISETGINQAKKDKNEHEIGKHVKSQSRGSKLPFFELRLSKYTLGNHRMPEIVLGAKFEDLAEMVP
jgi:hypothetical protein